MPDRDDRVLAIMVKAPRAGHVKTRLAAVFPPDAVLSLYAAFVADTIELARGAGLRTVAMCPADDSGEVREWLPPSVEVVAQRGTGLAAGLCSTFELLCMSGERRVIAFNADSPHLPERLLATAYAALATHDLVIGPCDDGGYYLVGAKRAYAGLFDASKMGRETACAALRAEADRQNLRTALVDEHYDVDLPADVLRLARDLAGAPARAPRTAAILAAWGLIAPRP